MAEVKDVTTGITKDFKSYQDTHIPGINTENLVKHTPFAPFVGKGIQAGKDVGVVWGQLTDPNSDADWADVSLGLTMVVTDTTAFIQSASDTLTAIASDPLGWLIGQGLNFLLSVVQPLQDAIHFVSGDGPALEKAAANFGAIAKGLQELSINFADVAEESLATWEGDAGKAAKTSLGQFANGINGVAAKSGDLAQMLQLNSMLMTFIEELIKAILTELVTWLIMIWIPALALAVPTFGGSTAQAGALTVGKAATTTAKTAKKVSKLQKILADVMKWLRKLQTKLSKSKFGKLLVGDKTATNALKSRQGKGPVDSLWRAGDKWKGEFGKRHPGEPIGPQHIVADTLKAAGRQAVKSTIGLDPDSAKDNPGRAVTDTVGKLAGHAKNAKKAADHGDRGAEQSDQQTKDDLDI